MRRLSVTVRGVEIDVEYDYDDDPSTNSCTVEWTFANPEDRIPDLTDEESEAIDDQIIAVVSDPHYNDDQFLSEYYP